MTSQHEAKDRGEYLDRSGAIHHVSDGEEIELHYASSHSGTVQIITGTVGDAHLSERTAITTDDGVRYELMGRGWADRRLGEVVKGTETGRRRVGWFDRTYRLEQPAETEPED